MIEALLGIVAAGVAIGPSTGLPGLRDRCAIVETVVQAEGSIQGKDSREVSSIAKRASNPSRNGERVVVDVRWRAKARMVPTRAFALEEKCESRGFVLLEEMGTMTTRRRVVRIDLLPVSATRSPAAIGRELKFGVWEDDSIGPPKGWAAAAPYPAYEGTLTFCDAWKGRIELMSRVHELFRASSRATTKKKDGCKTAVPGRNPS